MLNQRAAVMPLVVVTPRLLLLAWYIVVRRAACKQLPVRELQPDAQALARDSSTLSYRSRRRASPFADTPFSASINDVCGTATRPAIEVEAVIR